MQTENDKKDGLKEFGPSGEVLKNLKQLRFRSYNSPEEGAADYWRLLNKYGDVLKWFGTGDALHSGLALGDKTYYTANRFLYSGAMSKLYNQFMKNIAPQLSGVISNPQPPPGPLPEYKAWKNAKPIKIPDTLVSNIEKNTIYTVDQNNDKPQPVALNSEQKLNIPAVQSKEVNNEEIDGFMNYLYAEGPLSLIVKKSIESKLLNKTSFTVNIKNNDYISVKFAKSASELIKECFDCPNVDILSDDNNIEISSVIMGEEDTVLNAVSSAITSLSKAFSDKYKHNVKTAICAEKSDLIKVSQNIINKNERLFHLKVING